MPVAAKATGKMWLVVMVATSLLIGACTAPRHTAPPAPSGLSWQQAHLPTDPRGRAEVRDLTACAGHWYAAGALITPGGTTAPALWSSVDGLNWTALVTKPISAYGPTHVLNSVACDGRHVVAVGTSNGGAHGNPRTGTWISPVGSDTLTEVAAPFEQYGGPDAIGVGRISAGGAGWLIVGARIDANGTEGAAVWQSTDGHTFRLIDADTALESDSRGVTEADDALVLAGGYLVVGAITPPASPGSARDPAAWYSTDGQQWQRLSLPATAGDDLLQRAVPVPGGILAIGTDPAGFSAWMAGAAGGDWRRVAQFGRNAGGATVPAVTSLAAAGSPGTTFAVVSDSQTYQLWRASNGTGWTQVPLPVPVLAAPVITGPRVVRVAANANRLVLVTDDGTVARMWYADLP